jgi:hypothetical protein
MSSRTLWIAGLIVVLGVTVAIKSRWLAGAGGTAADTRSATLQRARPDAEPVAVAGAEAAQQTRNQNVRSEEPAQQDGAEPATTPAARSVMSLESLGVRTPPIPEFEQTERAFASEVADPTWSPEAEARILGDISQSTGLRALDIQVDCRTTMCRVQMLKPQFQQGSFEELVQSVGFEPAFAFNLVGRNGTQVTLAYLKRNTRD